MCFTMLNDMHDNLIGEYENSPAAKEIWEQLKFAFGGTSTTRLRALVLKIETYKDSGNSMTEHLRVISNMNRELKAARNNLIEEQQV